VSARVPIGIVDYGMGNRRSVEKAFDRIGALPELTGDRARLRRAAGLVIPGVGAFPRAIESLRRSGLDELITERAAAGVPVLGICLGMQLLFEASDEGEPTQGLGLLGGRVTALAAEGLRVPHIGWNLVSFVRPCPLTAALPQTGAAFYHVHSYAARPAVASDIVGTASYGESFASIVGRGNVYGVQFHPEKSSREGLSMLASFVSLAAGEMPAAAA
jgi:glutamine amidotransferase